MRNVRNRISKISAVIDPPTEDAVGHSHSLRSALNAAEPLANRDIQI